MLVVAIVTQLPSSPAGTPIDNILPERLDSALCPAEYGNPRPVLLISLDGFRADYLDRRLSPTIQKLGERGVRASYIMSVYPTKTFPNHYSIVTGLYPESHGIIANTFWDPKFKALFTLDGAPARNGTWWRGEPIWNTLTKQNKKSATFFWPGSDAGVQGMNPTHWFRYNGSVPYTQRVDKLLEWVNLPPKERPAWISLYFDEPDHEAHSTGPASTQVDEQIKRVDQQVRGVVEGLASKNLLHCVNILIVADHGMAQAEADQVIDLRELVPNITDLAYVIHGVTSRLNPNVSDQEVDQMLVQELSCAKDGLRAFLKEDLPKRFHYSANDRVEPVVLDLDLGYSVKDLRYRSRNRRPLSGLHGYDYYFSEMNALFVGYGPDLAQGMEVEPFQNIELYNLMCDLTGVTPAPNNGTRGTLHPLLAHPPPLPQPPTKVQFPVLTYSEDQAGAQVTAGCKGDHESQKDWSEVFDISEKHREAWELEHIPWGAPTPLSSQTKPPALLHHNTHITGYSQELKIPLWTSFTLRTASVLSSSSSPLAWRSDPRLGSDNTPACAATSHLPVNTSLTPLFPSKYAKSSGTEKNKPGDDVQANLISNAVAMNEKVVGRWKQLTEEQLSGWLEKYGSVNVVLGPVFDKDNDGLADSHSHIGTPAIPTDYFAVVTRCHTLNKTADYCLLSSLDALAFIYPHAQHLWHCASAEEYARMYSVTVRDVERAAGLNFFPSIYPDFALTTRVHSNLWEGKE